MPRFMAALVGTVGALALLLAAIGVYGMVRQAVVARTREFGVRIALGATPAGLAGSALSPVLRALAMGAAVGLVGAWAGARGLASLLHGVPAHDAVALSVAFAVVAVVVIAAAMLPARRVARLDPVLALRGDP
jgi:ABC-type antimicrobial peptide transport system permease subunit